MTHYFGSLVSQLNGYAERLWKWIPQKCMQWNVSCNGVQPPLMLHHKSIRQFSVIPYPAPWVVGVAWACPSCLWVKTELHPWSSLGVQHLKLPISLIYVSLDCGSKSWKSTPTVRSCKNCFIWTKWKLTLCHTDEHCRPAAKITTKTQWPWVPGHYKPAGSLSERCLLSFRGQLFHLKLLNVL